MVEWLSAGSMLAQRLRRWACIDPALIISEYVGSHPDSRLILMSVPWVRTLSFAVKWGIPQRMAVHIPLLEDQRSK